MAMILFNYDRGAVSSSQLDTSSSEDFLVNLLRSGHLQYHLLLPNVLHSRDRAKKNDILATSITHGFIPDFLVTGGKYYQNHMVFGTR